MNNFFPGDMYKTPDKKKRFFLNKLLFGFRWDFYFRFFGIVVRYRKYAVNDAYTDEMWEKTSHLVLEQVEGCGGKVTIEGINNLREEKEPVVFVSNHMSTLETVIMPCIINPIKRITFVVKEKLTKGPIFGVVTRSREPIVVGRTNPREDLNAVLTDGVKHLKNGKSVLIFPEGTRRKEFKEENFNSLGIKLALKAGVKVIPIAIKTDFWSSSKIIRGFGPIKRKEPIFVSIGKAIELEGRGKKQHEECVRFIKEKTDSWK